MNNLYDKFIAKLVEVNDETKTVAEHRHLEIAFNAWKEGVKDAGGRDFNGDYYYIAKIDAGDMRDRPMCCGVFLDWESSIC